MSDNRSRGEVSSDSDMALSIMAYLWSGMLSRRE